MIENLKETENSFSSIKEIKFEIKLSQISQDIFNQTQKKNKNKYYYLYRNGKKYILKRREKENSPKETKNKRNQKITPLEKQIHDKFHSKYVKMPYYYNTIVANRLMHSINSHVVSLFKEFLIYDDIFEFLTKFYRNSKSSYLLRHIIDFYVANNIIYPNYVILPEGNYIYRNIQQKQRIIDNQEKNLKKKKKEEKERKNNFMKENKDKIDENIFNSNIMDSILNQTNTSEARKFFGINDNSSNEIEDNNKIHLLIDNIDKAEDIKKKNNIFQKKKLIRIVNNIKWNNNIDDKKENYFLKMCQYMNNNNLYFTVKSDNENIYKKISHKKAMLPKLLSTISHFKNINNEDNISELYGNMKKNTIDVNIKNPRKRIFFMRDSKEESNNSNNSKNYTYNSPYITKRPIKQSTSYNKKTIHNRNACNNTLYLKKNDKSINKSNFFEFSPYKNYFKTTDDEIAPKIYTKKNNKIFRINTDTNIDNITKKLQKEPHSINKKINEKKDEYLAKNINKKSNMDNINNNKGDKGIIYNKINNIKYRNSLSNNKINYKKSTNYSNHMFKSIAKMIKRKYIIDDELNINNNSNIYNNIYHSQNKIIISTPIYSKNHNIKFERNKENERNNNSKNIYISNNITNNNYYTIGNDSRKNDKLLIKKYSKKTEINRRKINKILNIKNRNEKRENIFSESNLYNSSNYNISKSNNLKYSINDNSKSSIKTRIISPYKNGLINKTTLKSLDKYSLKYLLNKFNSKDKYENRNKNKSTINNENYQTNIKYKSINNQNDIKNENKIKRKYLILHGNRNNENMRNIKRNTNQINKLEINQINQNNDYSKTVDKTSSHKTKISSLSTKNNNRNNKIKFYK